MGFISCHIIPLVIHSLGGEHTHIQANIRTETILGNHAAGASGLKVAKVGKYTISIDAAISNVPPAFFIVATNVSACDNFVGRLSAILDSSWYTTSTHIGVDGGVVGSHEVVSNGFVQKLT